MRWRPPPSLNDAKPHPGLYVGGGGAVGGDAELWGNIKGLLLTRGLLADDVEHAVAGRHIALLEVAPSAGALVPELLCERVLACPRNAPAAGHGVRRIFPGGRMHPNGLAAVGWHRGGPRGDPTVGRCESAGAGRHVALLGRHLGYLLGVRRGLK